LKHGKKLPAAADNMAEKTDIQILWASFPPKTLTDSMDKPILTREDQKARCQSLLEIFL